MHLCVDGLIKVSAKSGPGTLLLTSKTAFFFISTGNPGAWAVGGLVGALVGNYLLKKAAEKNPPEHLQDPEIRSLDQKAQRKVLATTLAAKFSFNEVTSIKETGMGFIFESSNGQRAEISSWVKKKQIAAFLSTGGHSIDPR